MPITQTFTARWLFPVTGPPFERGTLTISADRIVAVEPAGRRADVDLGNVALIPGLVNPHTHLDLSGARGQTPAFPAERFPDWLRSVIAYRRARAEASVAADIEAGLAECLRYGTTLVGDIAAEGRSWSQLAAAPVRAVVFHELLGLSTARCQATVTAAESWLNQHPATSTCRPGLSPHAPYSTSPRLVRFAETAGVPLATHVAESTGERELLQHRTGPFVPFLQELGVWQPAELATSFAEYLGIDSEAGERTRAGRRLFVHANDLIDSVLLAGPECSIVYCPRTHAAFGHPPHPYRYYLREGIRLCLGTDSLASNPDLDPLSEAAFLRQLDPTLASERLLRMITLDAAESLGFAEEVGSLTPGKSADFVTIPLRDANLPDPHDHLYMPHTMPRRTFFRGEWRNPSSPG